MAVLSCSMAYDKISSRLSSSISMIVLLCARSSIMLASRSLQNSSLSVPTSSIAAVLTALSPLLSFILTLTLGSASNNLTISTLLLLRASCRGVEPP
ncbi:hypothetical protein BJY01DRAFT_206578, partial [Aspergillus pseudoustus]